MGGLFLKNVSVLQGWTPSSKRKSFAKVKAEGDGLLVSSAACLTCIPLSTLTLQALLSYMAHGGGSETAEFALLLYKSCPTCIRDPHWLFFLDSLVACRGAGRICHWIWDLVWQLEGGGRCWSCRSPLCIWTCFLGACPKKKKYEQLFIEWLRGDKEREKAFSCNQR